MTPAQTALYWREWNAARQAGQLTDADRYTLMEEALGGGGAGVPPAREGVSPSHLSSKSLTNEQLDKVLAAFRRISQPDNLNAQLHAARQPRARLLHGIHHAADLEYTLCIAHDKFGHTDLDRLTIAQLKQLLMTLKSRAKRRAPVAAALQPAPPLPIAHHPSPILEPATTEEPF